MHAKFSTILFTNDSMQWNVKHASLTLRAIYVHNLSQHNAIVHSIWLRASEIMSEQSDSWSDI